MSGSARAVASNAVGVTKDIISCALDYVFCALTLAVSIPTRLVVICFNLWYIICQSIISFIFKPRPPPTAEHPTQPYGRIAVIGAGLTGISSAAHFVAHGFDVVIFEQSDKIGGIWSNVNATSGLQLNSLLYRFHPGVLWKRAFPHRNEILSEVDRIWCEYHLEPKTRFNTRVTSVRRAFRDAVKDLEDDDDLIPEKQGHARWVINDGKEGVFDALVATIGTCGDPNMVSLPGMPGRSDPHPKKSHKKGGQAHNKLEEGTSARESSVWTTTITEDMDTRAVARNQEEKKNQKFLTPGEAYHGESDSPVHSDPEDRSTQSKSVWSNSTPTDNAWDVGRNQVEKKEQGFPTPGEAFAAGQDSQEGAEDISFVHGHHEHVRNTFKSRKTPGEKKRAEHGKDGDLFKGPILHSSQLDREGASFFEGKTVAVVGGGASAVEAVETALAQGAEGCMIIVRDDKWIIPRNIFIDTLIALQPFGREMPLSHLWEKFVTVFNYYGVSDLAPARLGLFESTPVVNDDFLGHVRKGRCQYIRGDTERLTSRGVLVNVRSRDSKPGDKGEKKEFDADIVVLATGFKKPDVDFLPKDLFPEGYDRPNLYLQTFSTEDWSVLMMNSAYKNAIGTVGHFHIGIYARILMTFLMDRDARPTPKDMKLWVDCVQFLKRGAKGGAFGFFTYMELMIWLAIFHIFRLDRLKWLFFILQGWGVAPAEYRK